MQVQAVSRSVKISPRKVRIVADAIRSLSVSNALEALALIEKRGGSALEKTLKSAIANAVNNAKLSQEGLFIKEIDVTDGPALKRYHPSTRGRIHPYKKRSSHIRIVLEEKKGAEIRSTNIETRNKSK